MEEWWDKRISATIPLYNSEDSRQSYSYEYSLNDLDNHPCTRRFNINADNEEILRDLNDVVLATQLHKCGAYCQRQKNKYKEKKTCRFNAPWAYDELTYPEGQPPKIIIEEKKDVKKLAADGAIYIFKKAR